MVLRSSLLILNLARPRTWAFAMASYLFAYTAGLGSSLLQALAGSVLFGILTGATNLINAHTDRSEDAINNPQRLAWLERIGRRNVVLAIVAFYLASFLLAIPFGSVFMAITAVAIFVSLFYSLHPLRFKRHPVLALISFSAAVGLPFLAGLAAADLFNPFNPLFIALTYFMLTYGAVKNIPDYAGDRAAGLKTTATVFTSLKHAINANVALSISPFLVISGLVSVGLLETVYLLNLALLGFPIYFAIANHRATSKAVYERVHTLNFAYAVSFILFNYLLTVQTYVSIGIALSIIAFIFLVSKLKVDSRNDEIDLEAKLYHAGQREILVVKDGVHRY